MNEVFGPKEVKIVDVGINTLGAVISGLVGSIILVFLVFFVSKFINIPDTFETTRIMSKSTSMIFPILLSILTLLTTSITIFVTYFLLTLTDPNKYKKNIVHFSQLALFIIITYIFITPIYIVLGLHNYDYIMFVFIFHTIFLAFGSSIILEVLNNYRYVLVGIYGSFVAVFTTILIVIMIFGSITDGKAKLVSLLVLLPIINGLIIGLKNLFELAYFHYYKITGLDQIGDVFSQIEYEENEELRKAEITNNF